MSRSTKIKSTVSMSLQGLRRSVSFTFYQLMVVYWSMVVLWFMNTDASYVERLQEFPWVLVSNEILKVHLRCQETGMKGKEN